MGGQTYEERKGAGKSHTNAGGSSGNVGGKSGDKQQSKGGTVTPIPKGGKSNSGSGCPIH